MALGEPDEKGRRKPVGTGEFETLAVDSVRSEEHTSELQSR